MNLYVQISIFLISLACVLDPAFVAFQWHSKPFKKSAMNHMEAPKCVVDAPLFPWRSSQTCAHVINNVMVKVFGGYKSSPSSLCSIK
jgi:protoheme ferro-lyase